MPDSSDPTPNRRELLGASLALPLLGCPSDPGPDPVEPPPEPAPDRPAEPGPWQAEGSEDLTLFPLGVQSGDPTPSAAIVWSRYDGGASLELVVVAEDGDGWVEVERLAVEPDEAGVVKLDVTDLDADTGHRYAFVDTDGARSPVGRFRTAPESDAFRKVVVGATSCTNQGNRPFPCLSYAVPEELDAFLLLGDTTYCDSATDNAGYQGCWAANFGSQGYLDLRGSTSTVMTWDDHEIDNVNQGEWEVPDGRRAIATEEFWRHNSIRPGPVEGRIWRKLSFGQALDLFVLDCRGERDEELGIYVSPEQLQWLLDGLSESTAAWKLVLNSVPMANLVAGVTDVDGLSVDAVFDAVDQDRWEGYPEQRAAVLDHIVDNGITGVVWVSGDVHFGAVMNLELEGPWASQFDVIAGPGGQTPNPLAALFPDAAPFHFSTMENNWVRFEADPGAGTLEVTFIGDDGEALHEQTLTL